MERDLSAERKEWQRSTDMVNILYCVVCNRFLNPDRKHVDTCGERCFKILLKRQRASYGAP